MNNNERQTVQCKLSSNKKKIKLLHYLQENGYAKSNKKAKKLIRDNRVIVNGSNASSCSMMVSCILKGHVRVTEPKTTSCDNNIPETTSKCNGMEEDGLQRHFCIVYHKPCGMICTTAAVDDSDTSGDKQKKKKNMSLANMSNPIPGDFKPVGRLDRHSHGLLLFSTDGRLTSALLSPRTSIERVYKIIVRGDVGSKDSNVYRNIVKRVKDGIETNYGFFQGIVTGMKRDVGKDGYVHENCADDSGGNRNDRYGMSPDEYVLFCSTNTNNGGGIRCSSSEVKTNVILSSIIVKVQEGKKRMVRRLFAALNLFVVDLKRIKYGSITLSDLPYGEWRYTSEDEVSYCHEIIKTWDNQGAGWDKKSVDV